MICFGFDRMKEVFEGLLRLRVENFVIFAIIAYFSGWLYVNYFFSEFHINRSSFSFDNYTIIVYFFYVLIKAPDFLFSMSFNSFFGLLTLIGAFVVSAIRFTKNRIPALDLVQRVAMTLLIFLCIFYFSIDAGQRDARSIIYEGRTRPVSIVFTKDIEEAYASQFTPRHATFMLCELTAAGDLGGLALVWRSSEETLILRYRGVEGTNRPDPISTYRIPNQFIALVESKMVNPNQRENQDQSIDCMRRAHSERNVMKEVEDESESTENENTGD